MPRFQITLVLLLILFFQSNRLSFASAEVKAVSEIKNGEKPFSADWPAERPPGESLPIFRSHNCGGGNRPPLYFAYWIHSYFEPKNLSKQGRADLQLQIRTENWKNWYKLQTTNCTPADLFYIEQAIWEASPFACTDDATSSGKWRVSCKGIESIMTHQRREKIVQPRHEPVIAGGASLSPKNYVLGRIKSGEGLCNSFSCEALYRKEHQVKKEVAVMHFIPLATAQCFPRAIEQNELHSSKNLKAIESSKFNSTQLDAFRDEWKKFLKTSPNRINRQTIFREADRLAAKYNTLFAE